MIQAQVLDQILKRGNIVRSKDPKVSVLLSVYNDEKYIGEAVDSILSQTLKDFELLIIDDSSTDKTRDIISAYKDPRIRLVKTKNNIGITKSLNKGLGIARGKYIARLDSDDISCPDRLEKQLICIESNKNYAMVGSRTEVIDESGKHIQYWNQEEIPELIFYTLSYRNCLTSSSVMFDKEIVISLGGYDESCDRAEDFDLWYKISRKYKIYTIPEYLVKWRKRDESHSFKNIIEVDSRYRKIVIERSKIDEKLLDYLLGSYQKKSFLEKFKMAGELGRFQNSIKVKGEGAGLSRNKLRIVCFRMMIVFIIKIFIGKTVINFAKKIFKTG